MLFLCELLISYFKHSCHRREEILCCRLAAALLDLSTLLSSVSPGPSGPYGSGQHVLVPCSPQYPSRGQRKPWQAVARLCPHLGGQRPYSSQQKGAGRKMARAIMLETSQAPEQMLFLLLVTSTLLPAISSPSHPCSSVALHAFS